MGTYPPTGQGAVTGAGISVDGVPTQIAGLLDGEGLVYNAATNTFRNGYSTGSGQKTVLNGSVTTVYNVGPNDLLIVVDTGSATVTVNLPAASVQFGRRLLVVKRDSGAGTVVVQVAGSDSIEGSSSKTLASQYDKLGIVSDGTSLWFDLGDGAV